MPYSSVFVASSLITLLPILCVLTALGQGIAVRPAHVGIALAFLIPLVADVCGFLGVAPLASNLYPVVLSAVLGALLLADREAVVFAVVLAALAFLSLWWRHGTGFDVLTRTVAFGGITVAAWRTHRIARGVRTALTLIFGAGLLAWWYYCSDPGWLTWGVLQGTRLTGILRFCWAVLV